MIRLLTATGNPQSDELVRVLKGLAPEFGVEVANARVEISGEFPLDSLNAVVLYDGHTGEFAPAWTVGAKRVFVVPRRSNDAEIAGLARKLLETLKKGG